VAVLPPHLLPEETGKTKQAPRAITRTEQTKKHCENQEGIRSGNGDDDMFVTLHVGRDAA